MDCFVYRSNSKPGMYLYITEKDNFEKVPESLLAMMGNLEFSFEFNLSKHRKLVKAEAEEVIRIMSESGYFLQMPPAKNDLYGHSETLN